MALVAHNVCNKHCPNIIYTKWLKLMNLFANALVCLISTSLIGKPKLRFKLGSFVKYISFFSSAVQALFTALMIRTWNDNENTNSESTFLIFQIKPPQNNWKSQQIQGLCVYTLN